VRGSFISGAYACSMWDMVRELRVANPNEEATSLMDASVSTNGMRETVVVVVG
jgi:hypothetical protein